MTRDYSKPVEVWSRDSSQEMERLYESERFEVFVAGDVLRVCRREGEVFSATVGKFSLLEDPGRTLSEIFKEVKELRK